MEMDAFEANMLLHYQGKSLLPIELQCRQGSVNISYEISGMYSLQQMTERRELQEKDLKPLFQAVLTCYEEISEYLLPPEGILLRPEWWIIRAISAEALGVRCLLSSCGASCQTGLESPFRMVVWRSR